MHICILHVFLLPMEARKGGDIPETGSCRWLWAATWVLRIKYGSSSRAVNVPNSPLYHVSLLFLSLCVYAHTHANIMMHTGPHRTSTFMDFQMLTTSSHTHREICGNKNLKESCLGLSAFQNSWVRWSLAFLGRYLFIPATSTVSINSPLHF